MPNNKKKAATKSAKKKVASKSPRMNLDKTTPKKRAEGINNVLVKAREVLERKSKGFVVVAKLTDRRGGFSQAGGAVANDVNPLQIAQVILDNFAPELSPIHFILAAASGKAKGVSEAEFYKKSAKKKK